VIVRPLMEPGRVRSVLVQRSDRDTGKLVPASGVASPGLPLLLVSALMALISILYASVRTWTSGQDRVGLSLVRTNSKVVGGLRAKK
jgi:hypothetical protein